MSVRLITRQGAERAYGLDPDFEIPDDKSLLQELSNFGSLEELLSFFGIYEENLLFYSDDFPAENLSIKDIARIRFAEGCVLYGEDAEAYLEDLGFDLDNFDPDSEEVQSQVTFNDEDDILQGYAKVFDLINRTVEEVPLESDDSYGASTY